MKNSSEKTVNIELIDTNIEDNFFCRICYDNIESESFITPCYCKGSMALVHKSCLEHWLAESNSSKCELCNFAYTTQRAIKYKVSESLWQWFKYNWQITESDNNDDYRNISTDIILCCLIIPFGFLGSYLCILTVDYYSQIKFANVPGSKWTSISLLIIMLLFILGFYFWLYCVLKFYQQKWFKWWQREIIVKLILEPDKCSIETISL